MKIKNEEELRDDNCSDNPACYYKQLQRAKEAISKIEEKNETLKKYVFYEDSIKYRAALEEIREMAKYDCEKECSNNHEICIIGSCLEKRIQIIINEVLND